MHIKNKAQFISILVFIAISLVAAYINFYGINFDFRGRAADEDRDRRYANHGFVKEENGPCKHLYKVKNKKNNHFLCSHGPDLIPQITTSSVQTKLLQNTNVLGSGIVLDGDGRSGMRIQVLYAYFGTDNYGANKSTFTNTINLASQKFTEGVAATGGNKHIRFVTNSQGTLDIQKVQITGVTMTGDPIEDFQNLYSYLEHDKGMTDTNRTYLIFLDTNHPFNPAVDTCSVAGAHADDSLSASNQNNFGPNFIEVDKPCWGFYMTVLHEISHTLGAVQIGAQNSNGYHSTIQNDVMDIYANVGDVYDVSKDSYCNNNPAPGSYLYYHWNPCKYNRVIIGADPVPNRTPPTPTPTPSNCATRGGICIINETVENDCVPDCEKTSSLWSCPGTQQVCCYRCPTPTPSPTPTPTNCRNRGGICIINETSGNDCSPKCERSSSTYSCSGSSQVCCITCPTPTNTPTPTRRPTPTPTPRWL